MANKSWQLKQLAQKLREVDPNKTFWSYFNNGSIKLYLKGANIFEDTNLILTPLSCGQYWRVVLLPYHGVSFDLFANMPKVLFDKMEYQGIIEKHQNIYGETYKSKKTY